MEAQNVYLNIIGTVQLNVIGASKDIKLWIVAYCENWVRPNIKWPGGIFL